MLVGSPAFGDLPPEEIALVTEVSSLERYAAGASVVEQGVTENSYYIIPEGDVIVTAHKEGEAEQHLATLTRGNQFGEMAVLFDTPRTATVRAASPVSLLVLRRDAFYQLLEGAPTLRARIEHEARARLRAVPQLEPALATA